MQVAVADTFESLPGTHTDSYAHYAAQLPTPRLKGQVTAQAERAARKAPGSDDLLKNHEAAATYTTQNTE